MLGATTLLRATYSLYALFIRKVFAQALYAAADAMRDTKSTLEVDKAKKRYYAEVAAV